MKRSTERILTHTHRKPAPSRGSDRDAGGAGHRDRAGSRRLRGPRAPGRGRHRAPAARRRASTSSATASRARSATPPTCGIASPGSAAQSAVPAPGGLGGLSRSGRARASGARRWRGPACNGPIDWKDRTAVQKDIANLRAALDGVAAGRGVHDGGLAGRHRALPAQRALPEPRGVPGAAGRRDEGGVRRHPPRGLRAPGRLPGPRDGPAPRLPRAEQRGVPEDRRGQRRGAQSRPARHPGRPDAPAPLLGQLRGAAPPRHPAARDPRASRSRPGPRRCPSRAPTRATSTSGSCSARSSCRTTG